MPRKTRKSNDRSRKTNPRKPRIASTGRLPVASDNDNRSQLLAPDKLKQLYTTMLQCRLAKERIRLLFQQGKLAENYYSRAGREASEVGAMIDLSAGDCVAPRRRDPVTCFSLGCGVIQSARLRHVFAQLLHPSNNGRRSVFPSQSEHGPLIVARESAMTARLNISTGVALAYKAQNKQNVVVAFSGDDSTALGSWHEAVDFAVANKLPIVHVVQNDVWTEPPDPRLLVAVKDMDNVPQDGGIPTLAVDGNDVVAVYRVAQEAIRRARQGHGPTLIECKTHRWPLQPGPAPTLAQEENLADPLSWMETYLKQKKLWSDAWKDRLVNSFNKQLDAAESFAQNWRAKGQLP
jgi:TPP-dependent pyruvate/acetoin dehydrogenase alpha subunit